MLARSLARMTASMGTTSEEAWVPIPSRAAARNANCGNDILRGRQLGQHATLFQSGDLAAKRRYVPRAMDSYLAVALLLLPEAQSRAPEFGRSMGSQIRIGQEEQLAGILLTVARFQKPSEGQSNRSRRKDAHNFRLQHCPGRRDARTKIYRRCFKLFQLKSMQHKLDKPTNCTWGTGQG